MNSCYMTLLYANLIIGRNCFQGLHTSESKLGAFSSRACIRPNGRSFPERETPQNARLRKDNCNLKFSVLGVPNSVMSSDSTLRYFLPQSLIKCRYWWLLHFPASHPSTPTPRRSPISAPRRIRCLPFKLYIKTPPVMKTTDVIQSRVRCYVCPIYSSTFATLPNMSDSEDKCKCIIPKKRKKSYPLTTLLMCNSLLFPSSATRSLQLVASVGAQGSFAEGIAVKPCGLSHRQAIERVAVRKYPAKTKKLPMTVSISSRLVFSHKVQHVKA